MTAGEANGSLSLDLGFTVGLEMPFEESVEWASDAGFDFVELLLDGPYASGRVADRVDEFAATLSAADMGIAVHLPFAVDPGSPFDPVRAGAVEELLAGMEVAVGLGAETVVFHPSSNAWGLGWTTEEARGFVHESLDELIPAARNRGLDPCVENVVSSYYDVTTFDELLERYPNASMTFDTSHALLAGQSEPEMAEFLRAHADRVGHLHIVDTRGSDDDEHLPVGMGGIDFETALSGLAAADWSGTATLEIGTTDRGIIDHGRRRVVELLADLG